MKKFINEKSLELSIIQLLKANGFLYIEPSQIKKTYNKQLGIDAGQLFSFLQKNDPQKFLQSDNLINQQKEERLIAILSKAIESRGVIDVLKNGIECHPYGSIVLFNHDYDKNNKQSVLDFNKNIFSFTNQLVYEQGSGLSVDICIFINGIPIITSELKSLYSYASHLDSQKQYQQSRSDNDVLFGLNRTIAHFCVDEDNISFTTNLKTDNVVFFPFNKGYNDGAGNPPSKNGNKTDFLWKEVLTKQNLRSLIIDFCYLVKPKRTNDFKNSKLVFPRYHQWRVVNNIINDVLKNNRKTYLIQHSAGSGKTNSIVWLANKFVGLKDELSKNVFDCVLIITDRLDIDSNITKTMREYGILKSTFKNVQNSNELKEALQSGVKIVISTIQKFGFVIDKMNIALDKYKFAIIIDEAHSSQGGEFATDVNQLVASKNSNKEELSDEDLLLEYMDANKMPDNATFFAFTATPKNKTIQKFGKVFDVYSTKQAIEEKFILDVLKNYITYTTYFKLINDGGDPNQKFEINDAKKKIKKELIQNNIDIIKHKAKIMVDHFIDKQIYKRIDNQAKAMVVCNGVEQAIYYHKAIVNLLKQTNTGFEALIAFAGIKTIGEKSYSEESINGFSDSKTHLNFSSNNNYRFLIVADKYQTGFDEPLLHTMYVDKPLNSVKAVQTLSRLNRMHPKKIDTCILDFYNDAKTIRDSFQDYYKETQLLEEVDVNQVGMLLSEIKAYNVFSKNDVDEVALLWMREKNQNKIEQHLASCIKEFDLLQKEEQKEFKAKVIKYIRWNSFFSSYMNDYPNDWFKAGIFLNILVLRIWFTNDLSQQQDITQYVKLLDFQVEQEEEQNLELEDTNGVLEFPITSNKSSLELAFESLEQIINQINQNSSNPNSDFTVDLVQQRIQDFSETVINSNKIMNVAQSGDWKNLNIELNSVFNQMYSQNIDLYAWMVKNDILDKLEPVIKQYILEFIKDKYNF